MSAHGAQFDEHTSKVARNAACGLAPDAGLGVRFAVIQREGLNP